ncbi:YhdP family protein [Methylohalobius crimeensis]
MIRIFHHTLRFTRWTLWLTLFLLAIGLSAIRFWLLPHIDRLRPQLETQLSQRFNQTIHIDQVKAQLSGITPELRLLGVTVGPDGEEQLQLQEIQLGLDLPASMRQGRIQPAWFRIFGAHVEIRRTPEGEIRILGLGRGEKTGVPRWLLSDGRFEILRSTLVWHPRSNNQPQSWHDIDIRFDNRGADHWLQIDFRPPSQWAQRAFLNAHFRGASDFPRQWRARFQLELKQLNLAPSMQHFFQIQAAGQGNVQVAGTWRQGRWQIDADLDLHHLNWHSSQLKRTLHLRQASGRIHGFIDEHGWQADTEALHLVNDDFNLYTRLQIKQPKRRPPHLQARAWLSYLNLSHLEHYLPRNPPANLSRWLDRKPLGGIVRGHLLWRGRLQDFPFRDHSGVSEARLSAHKVNINFDPAWPPFTAYDLSIQFHDGRVALEMPRGKLAQAQMDRATAQLDLTDPDPVMAIEGSSHAKVATILAVLQRSPLQSAVANLTRRSELKGKANVGLKISLPLNRSNDYQIDGRIALKQSQWQFTKQSLSLDELSGDLNFSRKQLTGRLTGKFRDEPARLEVMTDASHTQLTVTTRLDSELVPAAALRKYLKGTAESIVSLTWEHERELPAQIELRSNLQGISVNLPPPIGKPSDSIRPLQINTWLTSRPRLPLTLDYGALHGALTVDRETRRVHGRIGVGQPPPSPDNDDKGLILAGHLDHFSLRPWLALFQQESPGKTNLPELKKLDLRVAHLHVGKRDYGRHHFRAWRMKTGWEGNLTSPYTAGNWTWSLDPNRLDLALDFMHLDAVQHSIEDTASNKAATNWPPLERWPALTLRIDHLKWQRNDLGQVAMTALPHPPFRLGFDLSLTGDSHRLEASGSWHLNNPSQTRVEGLFRSDDMGRFLKQIGHPTALVQTPTSIDFQLHWPAPPYRFSLDRLNGRAQIDMGPGRWLDIEPGAGRLLGLLYLGTLERRLRLDFSDLFQTGMAYEGINGHIRLVSGRAFTDDLTISAVPARIHITGSADLINHQVNEYVSVFPNTPVTLGLFSERENGGLGKAAGIAQQLFNAPLDSITQSQYAISGTWDAPRILLLRRSLPGAVLHGIWSELKQLTGNHDE